MSSRRLNSPPASLCRFAFADGRHCRMLAQPKLDGLCFHHGTFRPRASRENNLHREAASLANGSLSEGDIQHTVLALSRGFAEGLLSPTQFSVASHLASLIHQSLLHTLAAEFGVGKGPAWEAIRRLIDRDSSSGHSAE